MVRDPDGGQTAAAVFRADFEAISAIVRETRDAVKALERAERARDAARATLEDASASAAASRDVSSDPSADPSSETLAARNEAASSAARRVVHSRAESKRHRAQVASLRATVREHRRAARLSLIHI